MTYSNFSSAKFNRFCSYLKEYYFAHGQFPVTKAELGRFISKKTGLTEGTINQNLSQCTYDGEFIWDRLKNIYSQEHLNWGVLSHKESSYISLAEESKKTSLESLFKKEGLSGVVDGDIDDIQAAINDLNEIIKESYSLINSLEEYKSYTQKSVNPLQQYYDKLKDQHLLRDVVSLEDFTDIYDRYELNSKDLDTYVKEFSKYNFKLFAEITFAKIKQYNV